MTEVTKILAGIDNGVSGATALLDENKEIIEWWDWSGVSNQAEKLKEATQFYGCYFHVNIEQSQAFPKMAKHSIAVMMQNYGNNLGVLTALDIKHSLVSAKDWKKKVLRGLVPAKATYAQQKQITREFVQRLYPKLKAGKNSGVWDAICIALYSF